MRPIHIAFDAQLALLENSLSRYTRNLVQKLSVLAPEELTLSLLVFSPRSSADIRAEQDWIPKSVELVVLPGKETPYGLSRWESLRRYQIALRRKMSELGADIFQGHYAHFPLPQGFRVATVVHDVFQWKQELGRAVRPWDWLRRHLDRWLYRQATLVCVSDSTLRDFQECLDPSHPDICRVHSGNDPCFVPETQSGDSAVLAEHQLESGKYFLYVGDLTPRKGVKTLIHAFRECLEQLPPDYRLALTKGHWQVCLERDLVAELGIQDRVTFLGQVPNQNLPALYRHCLAFVFPTLYEGFGFPPLEAMACGAPVVVSNNSSLPEIAGDAGILFPTGDVEALRGWMLRLAGDSEFRAERRQLGLAQAARFRWEDTAACYLDIYRRLARRYLENTQL